MSDRQCSSKNDESDARFECVCERKPASVVPSRRCSASCISSDQCLQLTAAVHEDPDGVLLLAGEVRPARRFRSHVILDRPAVRCVALYCTNLLASPASRSPHTANIILRCATLSVGGSLVRPILPGCSSVSRLALMCSTAAAKSASGNVFVTNLSGVGGAGEGVAIGVD